MHRPRCRTGLALAGFVLFGLCSSTWAHCGEGNGDCCDEDGNGSPGCDDEACCEAVCAQDPFCCEVKWDSICVRVALKICDVCQDGREGPGCKDDSDCPKGEICIDGDCVPEPVCGPGNGDCCEANGSPGCENEECCSLVCDRDPFCCDIGWDSFCVDEANELCQICDCIEDSECDDGDDCTDDLCNDDGSCSNAEIDCNDGDQCTADFCEGGQCQNEDNGECCEGCGTCAADVNCDGMVDPLDSGAILARFGLDPCNEELCKYDLNCSGTIDPLDAGYVLARFGVCNEPEVCKICE